MRKVVAVTGHRPQKLGGYEENSPMQAIVKRHLRAKFEELRPDVLISGMALGVDQWAARIALDIGIPLIAALPFTGQSSLWLPDQRTAYDNLLARANRVQIINQGRYAAWKMHARNEWMVTQANHIVAVWNRQPDGGTAACVRFALRMKIPVDVLCPQELLAITNAIPEAPDIPHSRSHGSE